MEHKKCFQAHQHENVRIEGYLLIPGLVHLRLMSIELKK